MLSVLPQSFFVIAAAVLGVLLGSFSNVMILRWNTGKSCGGRSVCTSCGHQLCWKDLFPVFSYLYLRARCRYCGSRISHQYILVEVLMAAMFAGVVHVFGVSIMTLLLLISAFISVIISVYDIKHLIIPDPWIFPWIGVSLLIGIVGGELSQAADVLWVLAAVAPLFLIWFWSKGRALGFADVKLMFGIGFTVGALGAVGSIILASMFGAVIGGGMLLWQRYRHQKCFGYVPKGSIMKTAIPFGPFLLLGMWIIVFAQDWSLAWFVW